jgi:hypothetical protein
MNIKRQCQAPKSKMFYAISAQHPWQKEEIIFLQNSMLSSAYRVLALESQRIKALSQLLKRV